MVETRAMKKQKAEAQLRSKLQLEGIYSDGLTSIAGFLDFLSLCALRMTSVEFKKFCTEFISLISSVNVDLTNLVTVAKCCKNLKYISFDHHLKKTQNKRKMELICETLRNNKLICEYDGNAGYLVSPQLQLTEITSLKFERHVNYVLETLKIRGRNLTTLSLSRLKQHKLNIHKLCPNLTDLSLFMFPNIHIPDLSIPTFIQELPKLRNLEITTRLILPDFPRSLGITSLSLRASRGEIGGAERNFPNLTSLSVSGFQSDGFNYWSPHAVLEVGRFCPHLQTVDLGNLNFSPADLCHFFIGCSSLKTFQAHFEMPQGTMNPSSFQFGDIFKRLYEDEVVLKNLTSITNSSTDRCIGSVLVGKYLGDVVPNLQKMSGIYPQCNLHEIQELSYNLNYYGIQGLKDFPLDNFCRVDFFPKLVYLKVGRHSYSSNQNRFNKEQVSVLRIIRPNCINIV